MKIGKAAEVLIEVLKWDRQILRDGIGFETLKTLFFQNGLFNNTCQEYFPKVLRQSEENSRRERILKLFPFGSIGEDSEKWNFSLV